MTGWLHPHGCLLVERVTDVVFLAVRLTLARKCWQTLESLLEKDRSKTEEEIIEHGVMNDGLGDIFLSRANLFKHYAVRYTLQTFTEFFMFSHALGVNDCRPFAATTSTSELKSRPSKTRSPRSQSFLRYNSSGRGAANAQSFKLRSACTQECFKLPESRGLPIDSFLITPLQRMVKYPLLLDVRSSPFKPSCACVYAVCAVCARVCC